jgi:ABC-type transporter Mla maintaining outer membrane lipid asymmetry ATPase subunit MlaF
VALSCRDLVAEYQGTTILDGFNLDLRSGETVALVVQSEWAARLIPRYAVGLAPFQSGEVQLLGKKLARLTEPERLSLRRQVGYVFHNSGLINNLTIWYNVALPALYHTRFADWDGVRARVEVVLERCLLKGIRNARPAALDDYSRKRAALARSWVLSPPVLILEDPLVEIDSGSSTRLLDFALGPTPPGWEDRDPKPPSPAMLITSQGLHESFFRFVDRLIVIEEGKVVFADDPKQYDRRGKLTSSDLINATDQSDS